MPLAEADKVYRDLLDKTREQMSQWRLERGHLLLEARESGMSVEEIASEIGATPQVVYDLTREAKENRDGPRPPRKTAKKAARKAAPGK